MLGNLPFDGLYRFEFGNGKKRVDRFLELVDVLHTVHKDYRRLMDTDHFENVVHAIVVDVLLVQGAAPEERELWQVQPGIIPSMTVGRKGIELNQCFIWFRRQRKRVFLILK